MQGTGTRNAGLHVAKDAKQGTRGQHVHDSHERGEWFDSWNTTARRLTVGKQPARLGGRVSLCASASHSPAAWQFTYGSARVDLLRSSCIGGIVYIEDDRIKWWLELPLRKFPPLSKPLPTRREAPPSIRGIALNARSHMPVIAMRCLLSAPPSPSPLCNARAESIENECRR